jgi:Tfp pilus assembly protein FimT
MSNPGMFASALAAARRATRRRVEGHDEVGFTLIELLITVVILPIVIGGIAVALVSVFSLQGNTTDRIGDSNDALVASVNFNRDVQSAAQMTTQMTPAVCGSLTQTQKQLLGLRWGINPASTATGGYDDVVSYVSTSVVNAQTGRTSYTLVRQQCTFGSTSPSSTFTVAHDIGTNSPSLTCSVATAPPRLCITGANNADVSPNFANWASAQGVTGVTFKIQAPGSQYVYSLVGLPGESTSQNPVSTLTTPTGPGCYYAASGSGTYANHLCFADFAGASNPLPLHSSGQCQTINDHIVTTPYTLTFCINLSQDIVAPAAIPTYYSPQGGDSEAFLGNNGFYTAIPGKPALYMNSPGGLVTVYLTNIQLLDAAGQPATGWTLVTGDAASTDTGAWMVYQSQTNPPINLRVLNNSPGNPFGNACYQDWLNPSLAPDPNNVGFLQYTGPTPPTSQQEQQFLGFGFLDPSVKGTTPPSTGAPSVLCESDRQLNKTGTLMLQAQEPANSSAAQALTVTMHGSDSSLGLFGVNAGLEGMFLGVLL